MFHEKSLVLHAYEDDSYSRTSSISPMSYSEFLAVWREGHLAFGGLLGKITFLTFQKEI